MDASPVSEWRGELVKLRRKGAWSELVFDERESGRLALLDEYGRACAVPLPSHPACPAAFAAEAAAAAAVAAEAAETV